MSFIKFARVQHCYVYTEISILPSFACDSNAVLVFKDFAVSLLCMCNLVVSSGFCHFVCRVSDRLFQISFLIFPLQSFPFCCSLAGNKDVEFQNYSHLHSWVLNNWDCFHDEVTEKHNGDSLCTLCSTESPVLVLLARKKGLSLGFRWLQSCHIAVLWLRLHLGYWQ